MTDIEIDTPRNSNTVNLDDSINLKSEDNINLQRNGEHYDISHRESHSNSRPNLTRDDYSRDVPKPKLVPMDGLDLLTNARKTKSTASDSRSHSDVDSDSDSDHYDQPPTYNMFQDNHDFFDGGDNFNDNNYNDNHSPSPSLHNSPEPSIQRNHSTNLSLSRSFSDSGEKSPPKSYEDIQREKQDILFKLDRLEKSGYKPTRRYTMASNIDDLRLEFSKLKRHRDVEKSIKFQRKALMACVSGIEFLNNKFDPIDARLDGWSESNMENINDYDEVFEELHDKYSDKVQVAPEIKLLMMVGGSAFMYHLTQTLFKSSVPGLNDILQQNPDIMKNIQQAALNSMNNAHGGDPVMNMMMNGVKMKEQARPHQPYSGGSSGMDGPSGVDDILDELDGYGGGGLGEESIRNVSINNRRRRKNQGGINIDL